MAKHVLSVKILMLDLLIGLSCPLPAYLYAKSFSDNLDVKETDFWLLAVSRLSLTVNRYRARV